MSLRLRAAITLFLAVEIHSFSLLRVPQAPLRSLSKFHGNPPPGTPSKALFPVRKTLLGAAPSALNWRKRVPVLPRILEPLRNRWVQALLLAVTAWLLPQSAQAALYQRKYRGPAWGNYLGYALGAGVVIGGTVWAYVAEMKEQKRITGAHKRVKKLEKEFMNVQGEAQSDDDLATELRDRLQGKENKDAKDGKKPPPPPEGREGRKRSNDPKRPPPSAPPTMTGKPPSAPKKGGKPAPHTPEDVDRLKKMWDSPGGDAPKRRKGDDDDDLLL